MLTLPTHPLSYYTYQFWAVAWYAGTKAAASGPLGEKDAGDKTGPLGMMYSLLLSFLAEDSFDQAVLRSDELRGSAAEMHSTRLSATSHYGIGRHALHYLLRGWDVSHEDCKKISLLLRMQMLELAQHDLGVVRYVSSAERSVLQLACRQLAYKAVKAAKIMVAPEGESSAAVPLLSVAALKVVHEKIDMVNARLAALPGAEATISAPPPLVLSEPEEHLARLSLSMLLGGNADGFLLAPATTTASSTVPSSTRAELDSSLDGVGVLGLYFAASGCSACRSVTRALGAPYTKLCKPQPCNQRLEIVLVSLDEGSEEDYARFRGSMPWMALPHDAGSLPMQLSSHFNVHNVPTLVLLRADGTLLSTDGIRLLRKHGRAFPWGSVEDSPDMPHLTPLLDRLVPREYVHGGSYTELPRYRAIDFLQQAAKVSTLTEAIDAIRQCDEMCTSLAVQAHVVKNTRFLIAALIEHTFTQLVPLPLPESHANSKDSIWAQPILYGQQLDLLILLQRIMASAFARTLTPTPTSEPNLNPNLDPNPNPIQEHFASSTLSVLHTRHTDAVRMVVPGCLAIVADAVMRRRASDIPSKACETLEGFTLGSADMAHQSATVPCSSLLKVPTWQCHSSPPSWAGSPGPWLRHALGTSTWAAQGPM